MSKYHFNNYKNIEAFERDKELLQAECENLELQINKQWASFKSSLKLKNIGEQMISKFIESKKVNLFYKFSNLNYLSDLISDKTRFLFRKIKRFFN